MARIAKSLEVLRNQVNEKYPGRNKASDGWIGNAAHAKSPSDHNPNTQGVVAALDITNDPANGLDVHALADKLLVNRHPNLKYIISNGRIGGAWTGWKWAKYTGSNPHTSHAHFSVGNGSDGQSTGNYDDQNAWALEASAPAQPPTQAPSTSGRIAQSGTFTAAMNMNIRRAPVDGEAVAILYPGQSVRYDSYIDAGGVRWISYIGNSGNRNYIARRKLDNSVIYGSAV